MIPHCCSTTPFFVSWDLIDWIAALAIVHVRAHHDERKSVVGDDGNRRALWDAARPFLRNPVAQQYRFEKPFDNASAKLGGISALCHYSMLADNSYTVYAVSKDTAKKMEFGKLPQIPDDETPGIVIQIMRYDIEYHDTLSIDPLTAILSLSDEDLTDPRLEVAIERILIVRRRAIGLVVVILRIFLFALCGIFCLLFAVILVYFLVTVGVF